MMCKKKFISLIFFVMVVGLAGSVNAATVATQASGDWTVATNWYDDITGDPGVPGPGDTAFVQDGFEITSTGTEEVSILAIGNAGTTGTLNVNGGSMTASAYAVVGNAGGAGTLNVSNASFTAGPTGLWAGYTGPGTINISNSTVDAGTFLIVGSQDNDGYTYISDTTMVSDQLIINHVTAGAFVGHLEVSGTTVFNTNHFTMTTGGGGTAFLGVYDDAQIIIDETVYGLYFDIVQGYIDAGWIDGSVAQVGTTAVISVVPEPTTLLLLGLGGMLIRRRRA